VPCVGNSVADPEPVPSCPACTAPAASGGELCVLLVVHRIVSSAVGAGLSRQSLSRRSGSGRRATVADPLGQATDAVSRQPKNALVVIQLVDNDTVCPATTADVEAFQMKLESVLAQLDQGLPTSRVFVVSHHGTATKDFATLTPEHRRQEGGTGPCAFIDPQGRLVPRELDRIEHIGLRYEAALKAGCLKFARCRYDEGAFHNAPVEAKFTSAIDLNHFSIAGHAEAAAVAWKARKRLASCPLLDEEPGSRCSQSSRVTAQGVLPASTCKRNIARPSALWPGTRLA
jgi:hypothetical protein